MITKSTKKPSSKVFNQKQRLIIYKELIKRYGISHQIDKCVEELAELIQALMKHRQAFREGGKSVQQMKRYDVVDELADVRILLEQMQNIYSISDSEIKNQENKKLFRQQQRLKK